MQQLLISALRRPAAFAPLAKPMASRALSTARPQVLQTLRATKRPAAFTFKTAQLPAFASKRFFTVEPSITARPSRTEVYKKLATSAALFGGTLVAINVLFNSEGRAGGIPAFERQYLKETFTYTGLGLGIMGIAAKTMHNVGISYRIMAANPWLVLGVGLVGSLGTMFGTLYTDPDNYVQKHAFWGAFQVAQAVTLSPLFFYNPAVLARAGLYTLGMMGSISYVAATAKEDKYLWLGGPLLGGLTVLILTGFAPMVLPLGTAALAGIEAVYLYGGLALFGGMTLYDVQKIQQHARLTERGMMKKDTVNESIKIELDFINIFVRMVQILGNRDRKR